MFTYEWSEEESVHHQNWSGWRFVSCDASWNLSPGTIRLANQPGKTGQLQAPSFLSKWVISAGAGLGLSALPFAEGHAVIGKTFVQEIWKYDTFAWVP
jgi:hypothetical protein